MVGAVSNFYVLLNDIAIAETAELAWRAYLDSWDYGKSSWIIPVRIDDLT